MKRILFVVGTRPEIIKTAPVIQALKRKKNFRVGVCLSGQHVSMVEQMLKDFRIKLDYDLKIMEKLSERRWHNTPITSIRRSFSNLSFGLNPKIRKTDKMIMGDYGRKVYVWELVKK